MQIRKANEEKDYDAIWEIFSAVIQTGKMYVFDPNTPKSSLHNNWFADSMDTFVAVDPQGEIFGTCIIKPNQLDLGNQFANCSCMVNPDFHSQSIKIQILWIRATFRIAILKKINLKRTDLNHSI